MYVCTLSTIYGPVAQWAEKQCNKMLPHDFDWL